MNLLLHAVSSPEVLLALPAGLRGRPLARVVVDGLAAWATCFDGTRPTLGRADLLEQHAIISRLHAQLEACLPARFPTWLADEAGLRADVARRQVALRAALETVRGQCELAVTVLWNVPAERVTETDATARTPGTRYLRERQHALAGADRRRERARELADEIERVAGTDLVSVERQVCPSAEVALSTALLAPSARAGELMQRLPRTQPGVRILVNGPWPPYTFASIRAREA